MDDSAALAPGSVSAAHDHLLLSAAINRQGKLKWFTGAAFEVSVLVDVKMKSVERKSTSWHADIIIPSALHCGAN
ncbi:hypothetical protein E2C01_059833 [Portunus trituberculatus]|uniref:Uncharacterized protein n=1 Tax=Portunus trituberculatus TaxID=210409 RepID=A0A5B7H8W8_PORTR|nr:hypothetical protein [Portunus trituberculatus]